jgi:proline dehydrogenase
MRSLFLHAQHNAWLERQMRRRAFARKAISRFMPGERADDALAAARELAAHGLRSVLTELGENVATEQEVTAVRQHYEDVLRRVAETRVPAHVSVKLTHLGLDVNDALCRDQVRRLADVAHRLSNVLWIDMEGSAYTDRTLDVFRSVRREFDSVGVCVQAYLYRTAEDLDRLAPLAPAIRLVKGAYQEPPSVAFPKKRDVDENYFQLARRLLDDQRFLERPGPAFGTHDLPLIRRVARAAEELGARRDAYEIQMLYGIRRNDQRALADEGFTVRILVSYGEGWFPWYMRRLAERPANVGFVIRSMLGG